MKRHLTYLVLTAGLSTLLGTSAISAQQPSEVATIPFDFHVNTTTLPAGKYTVSRDANNGITRMREQSGRGIFVTTVGSDTDKTNNPRLTFSCYGENCVLSQIWMSDGLGYGVTQSRSDREQTRKMGIAANVRSIRLMPR